MFLEQYQNTFNPDKGDVFEKNSILDEPLFGLNEYYSPEYLASDYMVKVKHIGECQNELENTLQKFKFISSYLIQYKNALITESVKLDEEFIKISNSISTKGQAFLDMFVLTNDYNYIFDEKIVYAKNVVTTGTDFIKSSNKSKALDYYIEYVNEHSFFIILGDMHQISDIVLELYNDYKISIFGGLQNDTLENIVADTPSSQKLFINKNKAMYKKLFVISDKSITKYIKNIKVFASSDNKKDDVGFIVRELNNLSKLSNFIIASDSNTKFYLYDEETYEKLRVDLTLGQQNRYVNENYMVEANKDIQNTFNLDKMFLLEVLDYGVNMSYAPKLFGKEKINK